LSTDFYILQYRFLNLRNHTEDINSYRSFLIFSFNSLKSYMVRTISVGGMIRIKIIKKI
jgi:hypothetical protein